MIHGQVIKHMDDLSINTDIVADNCSWLFAADSSKTRVCGGGVGGWMVGGVCMVALILIPG